MPGLCQVCARHEVFLKMKKIIIHCNNCQQQVGILTEDCLKSNLAVITLACPVCNRICFSQPLSQIARMFDMPEGTQLDFGEEGELKE